ncbi:uncharacterized protein BDZ99DRAFT_88031 [Mytilinidion resinicola]|uniref:P-loop containing nucleoside triphosphate hydrolase protein n=1 Tax=Mytilinidion resinicola TaxID=574789 RepID=A0A6A6YFU3_9PEZI|nr:uncharacterized protein BDZ99DRAFT_88031 [Mytilinidion resinicola]KAF2806915.1 hypothetical protein BDZ99DRAFT_88031 [Mytilinidion resinicola]
MWVRYLDVPSRTPPAHYSQIPETAWCSEARRFQLADSMNLTHRYFLNRANRIAYTPVKREQIAKAEGITRLLRVPYYILGQIPAAKLVTVKVLAHIAMKMKETDTSYVMAFAGPSGHGKTELAKQMGSLLSVETTLIDTA